MSSNSTKKLINSIDTCVDESIEGFLLLNQGLCRLEGHRVVIRRDIAEFKKSGRVTTLTGGGSGHEPTFMGYVGAGMVSAAVHGAIFASPSPSPILAALRVLGKDHPAGMVVLYNNYTGDRLNFGIAIERARAEGVRVGELVNACDCSLLEGSDKTAGRRGLCGIILMAKIIGSMAEEGITFEEIMQKGSALTKQVGSLGVCLSPCSLPGRPAMFEIGADDMEIGLGLHGEAGVKTVKMMSARECVAAMLEHITSGSNRNHLPVIKGSHVAVMLNNLGATTELEMNILAKETIRNLEQRCVHVDRMYMNRFATSMEMSGFHITLLLLDDSDTHWLDAETRAPGWLKPYIIRDREVRRVHMYPCISSEEREPWTMHGSSVDSGLSSLLQEAVLSGCRALVSEEGHLNDLDAASGDGDCGTTLKAGALAILESLGSSSSSSAPIPTRPASLLLQLAHSVEENMGGSSGALYSLLFTSAASACAQQSALTFGSLGVVLTAALRSLSQRGGAERGDRTMVSLMKSKYGLQQTLYN